MYFCNFPRNSHPVCSGYVGTEDQAIILFDNEDQAKSYKILNDIEVGGIYPYINLVLVARRNQGPVVGVGVPQTMHVLGGQGYVGTQYPISWYGNILGTTKYFIGV
jgi:hypothetical protein